MDARTLASDLDIVAKLTCLVLDLDAVVQVLFKGRTIENTVASGLGVVNDIFVLSSGSFSGHGLGLQRKREETQHEPTEKITQQSGTGTNHLDGSDGECGKEERGLEVGRWRDRLSRNSTSVYAPCART